MQQGYFSALILAILLHAGLLGILLFGFGWQPVSDPAAPPALAIQATVVDESMIAAELEKLEAADRQIRAAEERRARELAAEADRARAEREREEERLAALARQRDQAERDQQAQAERAAAEQRARAEAEQRRLAEIEAAREAEEQRLALAEQRRQEEEERARAARREREARQQAEREEQLRRALAEESARREAEDAGLLDEYKTLISQRIVRNWNQPPGAQAGLRCELVVTQIPGGEVVAVQIVSCNGDAVVERSIEAAVYKASPLPPPPDPRLFDRKVRVIFEPQD